MPNEQEQQQSREAVRPSTTIVTSENLAEFQAGKLGIEPPPKSGESKSGTDEASAKAGEPGSEGNGKASAAAGDKQDQGDQALEDEKAAEKDPKRQRLNMRFSELTTARDQARTEAAQERERRVAAERELAELKGGKGKAEGDKANAQPPAEAEKPDRSKFPAGAEGDSKFNDAMIDWRADQRIAERDRKASEQRAKDAEVEVRRQWGENQKAIVAVIPDYRQKIEASTAVLSDEVTKEIISMPGEAGPRCLYYFAEFPQEAERIAKLTVAGALRELGKIEEKVMAGKSKPDGEDKGDKGNQGEAEISKAPKPASTLKSSSQPEALEDANGQLKQGLSYKEYKAARKAGKIK